MNLEDRTAIVTGTASGMGKGIALRFAADGAAVAGFDIQVEKAEQTAAEIEASGGKALAMEAGVAGDSVAETAVSFLASGEAAYITGADFIVDGGRVPGPRGS